MPPRTATQEASRHQDSVAGGPKLALGTAVIVLVCFCVYAASLAGGFVWDDDTHLLDNPVFEPGGLLAVWFSPPQVINYWPVTFTSYWFEHALWGFDPLGYRIVNVLLHAGSSVLLWRVLARLRVPLPWLCALVFAVHPVNVESVAWVAQRKNLLSLLFFLGATWAYLRFEAQQRTGLYGVALASHLLAMLSKGAAAPFPAVVLLLAWWQRGTITRQDVRRSIPFFAITLAASLLEFSTQDLVADDTIVRDDGILARLASTGWVGWFYLGKALLPFDLCFVYPRWQIDPASVLHWMPLVSALGALAALFLLPASQNGWTRPVRCAVVYYGLLLSPVLGFFDIYYMRYSYVADHYQYLALIAVVALVVGGGGALIRDRWPAARGARMALGVFVVAAFGLVSLNLSLSYRGEERLWHDTLAKNPDAFLAHYNLAHGMERDDRLEDAAHHYREALRIEPDHAPAMNNLGQVLKRTGDLAGASASWRKAIDTDRSYVAPRNNLAVLQHREGDHAQARRTFEAALGVAPDSAVLHFNLARLLDDMGEARTALHYYRRAAALAPGVPAIQQGLRRAEQAILPLGHSDRRR